MRTMLKIVLVAVLVVAFGGVAFANAGLPMLAVYWPPVLLMLVPIILLEAAIGGKMLKAGFGRPLKAAALGNVVSTLLGIPLTWLVLALIEGKFFGTAKGVETFAGRVYAVTIQAPWLIPYEKDFYWMIPVAAIVLSIPFFFVSVLSEYYIARRFFTPEMRPRVRRWAWTANACTYALLIAIFVAGEWINKAAAPLIEWVFQVTGPPVEWVTSLPFRLL